MRNRGLLRSMAMFLFAFLLCGALRVLTYHKDLFEGFSPLFCGSLLLFWAVSVRTRVTDRRLRRLILGAASSLLLFLVLQLYRGCLTFENPMLQRYFWYGYYIPYIGTPLMLFLCALVEDGGGYVSDAGICRNEDAVCTPASTAKIVTMLCAQELLQDPDARIRIRYSDLLPYGATQLYVGDTLRLEDAIRIMMMGSNNTLANAIARTAGRRLPKDG